MEQAGLIKATVGGLTGQARARVVASAALEGDVRCVRGRRRPAGLGHRRREPAVGGHARRPEGAAEGAARHDLQARPRVHRADDLVELHVRGRRARGRAPAADGRRRHHRAALLARAVRHVAAAEDRAVGAGDDADGHGAVRLEARHLVPAEAARREPAQRPGARAGQGVAGRRGRAGGVDDRQDRSDRQPPGGARACSSTPSSARIWTTSRITQRTSRGGPSGPPMAILCTCILFDPLRSCSSLAARPRRLASRPCRSRRPIPAPATGRCGAARPIATWCRP